MALPSCATALNTALSKLAAGNAWCRRKAAAAESPELASPVDTVAALEALQSKLAKRPDQGKLEIQDLYAPRADRAPGQPK
jgi:hypothetical protein